MRVQHLGPRWKVNPIQQDNDDFVFQHYFRLLQDPYLIRKEITFEVIIEYIF